MGLVLLLVLLVTACEPSQDRPQLIVDESVAGDFEALAVDTWTRFLDAFQARADCFGDVHLRAVEQMDSRAAYDADTATVTVRVPGTPALLQGALVHEWAHHVEFQCAAHKELRFAFLAAQGLEKDTPWRPDSVSVGAQAGSRADIPSEQYAEAAIVLVLGRRHVLTEARVSPEAVLVLREWAAGD